MRRGPIGEGPTSCAPYDTHTHTHRREKTQKKTLSEAQCRPTAASGAASWKPDCSATPGRLGVAGVREFMASGPYLLGMSRALWRVEVMNEEVP